MVAVTTGGIRGGEGHHPGAIRGDGSHHQGIRGGDRHHRGAIRDDGGHHWGHKGWWQSPPGA